MEAQKRIMLSIERIPRKVERKGELAHVLDMLTPKQCKAARALLGWRQSDLAEKSGVGAGSVKDFESERHAINYRAVTALIRTFQKAGLILFFEDEEGAEGVRLKKKEASQ